MAKHNEPRNIKDNERLTDSGADTKNTPRNGGRRKSRGNRNQFKAKTNQPQTHPLVIPNTDGPNDFDWYNKIPGLVSDYASLPCANPLGGGLIVSDGPNNKMVLQMDTVGSAAKSVPGIITYTMDITATPSYDATSAINIAATKLYSIDRRANSGATNYDKTDLFMVGMALDSAYTLYDILGRAYRQMTHFNPMSRYTPDILSQAMGFDNQALSSSFTAFKGILDLFASKLGSINFPDVFPFIRKHRWAFSMVYTDATHSRAQMSLYVPRGLYKWVEGTDSKPTHLEYVTLDELFGVGGGLISSLDEIQLAIDTLMNPILGSQDIGTISGDIAKAWSENELIKISLVSDTDTIVPIYSEEIINQMMNTTVVAPLENNDVVVNYSDTVSGPFLECKPVVVLSDPQILQYQHYQLMNLSVDPTPENITTATRNMVTVDLGSSTPVTDGTFITSCDTLVCASMQIFWRNFGSEDPHDVNPTGYDRARFTNATIIPQVASQIDTATKLRVASLISAFDWHPTIYSYLQTGSDTFQLWAVNQDYNQYAWLSPDIIRRLNQMCVMSQFTVE